MKNYFTLCLLLLLLFMVIIHARSSQVSSLNLDSKSTYIVHMDKSQMPNVFTTHHHWYTSTLDSLTKTSFDGPKSSPSPILYSYDNALHGFSATLSQNELESLKTLPGFVAVYPDKSVVLDTTRTVDFLSLNTNFGLWPASDYGDDVIIGVIDSGIWPESKSFDDDSMSPLRKGNKWRGTCQEGEQFNSSMCNQKLIGASFFNKGVKAAKPHLKINMNSARDTNGHGTHTASTSAGNYVDQVSFFGYAQGTARGVAPRARLAIYKVVWDEGSYSSDLLAAMDQAISDGVDVISMSLGFDQLPLYQDPVAIGSFAAMEKGVFVSLSAGNGGPKLGSVHNGVPWALTTAASTIDRQFAGTLTLGNGQTILGWTMFPASAIVQNVPLLYNKSLSSCDSSTKLANAPYAIIICDDTGHTDDQMNQIAASNVAASIFISDDPKIFEVGGLPWPGIVISSRDAETVINYAKKGNSWASMQFQQTFIGSKPAPSVAFYTSRGPSKSYPGILKPDLMAPGSQVLAAYIPNTYAAMIGTSIMLSNDYVMLSGTSMACPHASGVAALLRNAHPDWSVAAIRSAMMTTANPVDNTGNPIRDNGANSTSILASPLAMGSGQLDPNRALDPGLIYDASQEDYMNLICAMNLTKAQVMSITRSRNYNCSNSSSDLNYPSFIAIYDETRPGRKMVRVFDRTVSSVGEGAAVYKAVIEAPKGCKVRVSPRVIAFKGKGDKQRYSLRLVCEGRGNVVYGSIVWVEVKGKHSVRSPIVVTYVIG